MRRACRSMLQWMPQHAVKEENGRKIRVMDAAACGVYESWMPRHLRKHAEASNEKYSLPNVECRSIRDCMPRHWSCNSEKNREFDFV